MASNAGLQKSLSTILKDVNAGAMDSSDTGYSLYIQDSDRMTGYQHVIFSSITSLFENLSLCKTLLNEGSAVNLPVTSLHTSALDCNKYPSTVLGHNCSKEPIIYHVKVYDEATGTAICGSQTSCDVSVQVAGNETKALGFHDYFETALNWKPTSTQVHINMLISDPNSSNGPKALVGQVIHNADLGGDINMSTVCAVNSSPSGSGAGGNASSGAGGGSG